MKRDVTERGSARWFDIHRVAGTTAIAALRVHRDPQASLEAIEERICAAEREHRALPDRAVRSDPHAIVVGVEDEDVGCVGQHATGYP
jgi:hypothetical protein